MNRSSKFDTKERDTFHSTMWKRDINSYLCSVTVDKGDKSIRISHWVVAPLLRVNKEQR